MPYKDRNYLIPTLEIIILLKRGEGFKKQSVKVQCWFVKHIAPELWEKATTSIKIHK